MRRTDSTTLEYVTSSSSTTRHITLIDPAKQDPNTAANRAMVAVECGSSMIFVGGSTDTPDEIVHATCKAIQEAFELRAFASSQDPDADEEQWHIPVVLFPGGAHALSPAADAITFMMLMNSSIRRFLVGEQIRGAPYREKFGVEALPTGYLVCAPGGRVGEVGQAELIQAGRRLQTWNDRWPAGKKHRDDGCNSCFLHFGFRSMSTQLTSGHHPSFNSKRGNH